MDIARSIAALVATPSRNDAKRKAADLEAPGGKQAKVAVSP